MSAFDAVREYGALPEHTALPEIALQLRLLGGRTGARSALLHRFSVQPSLTALALAHAHTSGALALLPRELLHGIAELVRADVCPPRPSDACLEPPAFELPVCKCVICAATVWPRMPNFATMHMCVIEAVPEDEFRPTHVFYCARCDALFCHRHPDLRLVNPPPPTAPPRLSSTPLRGPPPDAGEEEQEAACDIAPPQGGCAHMDGPVEELGSACEDDEPHAPGVNCVACGAEAAVLCVQMSLTCNRCGSMYADELTHVLPCAIHPGAHELPVDARGRGAYKAFIEQPNRWPEVLHTGRWTCCGRACRHTHISCLLTRYIDYERDCFVEEPCECLDEPVRAIGCAPAAHVPYGPSTLLDNRLSRVGYAVGGRFARIFGHTAEQLMRALDLTSSDPPHHFELSGAAYPPAE